MDESRLVNLEDVRSAARRLRGVVRHTPVLPSEVLGSISGCELFLKAECLQETGAFKLRGAYNKIATLPESGRRRDLIAASAGNHAQGVALAARTLGFQATIVMPSSAPRVKVEATEAYGARVILHGRGYDEAQAFARSIADDAAATYIHPFDDPQIIAGQGTIALEILRDVPNLDAIVVPVGGGGLISGVAVAAKSLCPAIRVFGVQSAAFPSAELSLRAGEPFPTGQGGTIADGIAVRRCGDLTLKHIRRFVDEIVTVSEESILRAMALLMRHGKLIVEGAGAVGLAAVVDRKLPVRGRRVAIVLSGGNVESEVLTAALLEPARDFGLDAIPSGMIAPIGVQRMPV